MAPNLPPHFAEEYQRIMGGRFGEDGEILTDWPASTPEDAKASLARARLVKKELSILKEWTRQAQRRAAGEAVALQQYDDLVNLIDRSLIELDGLTLQLEPKASSVSWAQPQAAELESPTASGDAAAPTQEAPFSRPSAPISAATSAPPEAADGPELPAAPAAPVPPRLTVHAGAASGVAVVTEWWRPPDGDVESRSLRFLGPGGTWLDGDDLPPSLKDAGCSITKVAGATRHAGIAHPTLNVGWAVKLRPEPSDPSDRNAVGVWTTDDILQVGYLPPEVGAATLAEARRRQSVYGALVVAEFRRVGSNERVGLKVLIGPGNVWAETSG